MGIDPGSRQTGYGLIEWHGRSIRCINSGTIKTTGQDFYARLGQIFQSIHELIRTYPVEAVAVEQVFMAKNASSSLKLAQARGAAITAAVIAKQPIYEYSPRQIKQTLVGTGRADKQQVQYMVQLLLNHRQPMGLDESDALAVAICHIHLNSIKR